MSDLTVKIHGMPEGTEVVRVTNDDGSETIHIGVPQPANAKETIEAFAAAFAEDMKRRGPMSRSMETVFPKLRRDGS